VELVPLQRNELFFAEDVTLQPYLKSLKQVFKAAFKTKNNRNVVAALKLIKRLIMIHFNFLFPFLFPHTDVRACDGL